MSSAVTTAGPPAWPLIPTAQALATAGQDGAVRIWDLRPRSAGGTGEDPPLQTLRGHTDGVFQRRVQSRWDQTRLGGQRRTARVWDMSATTAAESRKSSEVTIRKSAVSHFIPAGSSSHRAEPIEWFAIWNAATGRQTLEFQAAASRVNAIAFSPDGTKLATGSLDHTVNVWDAATGRSIAVFAGHATAGHHRSLSAATEPSWSRPAKTRPSSSGTWCRSRQCGNFESELRAGKHAPAGPPPSSSADADVSWVGGVAFRPSGKKLAAAGTNHTVAVWDLATGRLKHELHDGWGVMIALAYDHQGTRLAAAGTDRNVRHLGPDRGSETAALCFPT